MTRDNYLATVGVWAVLDLIAAEFRTDPHSTQCFDKRLVERAIELSTHEGNGPIELAVNAAPVLIVVQQLLHPHCYRIAERTGGEQRNGGPVAVTYRVVGGLPYRSESEACSDAILTLHRREGERWRP